MNTIADHVYFLRGLIKEHSDDSYYSDQQLYKALAKGRATLHEREAKKFVKLSPLAWQPICMPLVLDTYHDCDCLPFDVECSVLRSKYKVPAVTIGRNKILMKVTTLEGKSIDYVAYAEEHYNNAFSITKKDKLSYTIFNGYLWVFGTTTLGVVQVNGIFDDPAELANISLCNSEGEELEGTCYNVYSDEFPIKASLHNAMYEEALNVLKIPLSRKDDMVNDAIDGNG